MQAGTTGINAMRVYNVTKQGKDQDPNGIFIRRYISELKHVPVEYIHEPYNMPASMQKKFLVTIGNGDDKVTRLGFQPMKQYIPSAHEETDESKVSFYPSPIVDERASSKIAKDKLSVVRKQESTKEEAEQVFLKHGSRRSRGGDRDGVKPKALSSTAKRVKVDKGQTSLLSSWEFSFQKEKTGSEQNRTHVDGGDAKIPYKKSTPSQFSSHIESSQAAIGWSCNRCTFLNEKPLALACSVCGSVRQ